jgi:hypothetical protein
VATWNSHQDGNSSRQKFFKWKLMSTCLPADQSDVEAGGVVPHLQIALGGDLRVTGWRKSKMVASLEATWGLHLWLLERKEERPREPRWPWGTEVRNMWIEVS